ncbi:tetratricopeptide repeat protein [Williamsia maris]|uniref:tetratricopeptide repeat protein n=1 Tax=Williamsia maris TaxID=72806 RepID=UPI0020A5E3D3|nr:hypothetical protein [Williamsia maris]
MTKLLRSSVVSPIIFCGTIWPSGLNELSKRPNAAQMRSGEIVTHDLITKYCKFFHISDSFTNEEIQQGMRLLNDADAHDRRLIVAIATAPAAEHDGPGNKAVTQVLAGGEQLVARWAAQGTNAFSPPAHAIMSCVADIRRLGCPSPISESVIRAFAHKYLPDAAARRIGNADWVSTALNELNQSADEDNPYSGERTLDIHHQGVPALVQSWVTTRSGKTFPHYTPHEYLIQHLIQSNTDSSDNCVREVLVSTEKSRESMPWRAQKAVAIEAAAGGDVQLATAMISGFKDPHAAVNILLRFADIDVAINYLRPYAETSPYSATRLGRILQSAGRIPEALTVLGPFEDRPEPAILMAHLLVAEQREQEAVILLERTCSQYADCAIVLSDIHLAMYKYEDAMDAVQPWIETNADATTAMVKIALVRSRNLLTGTIVPDRIKSNANASRALALGALQDSSPAGTALAIELLTSHSDTNTESSVLLSEIYVETGHTEKAIEILCTPARRFAQSAVRRARLLLDAGREPDAIADLQRHHITSQEASLALADIHTKNGDPQKAIDALELPAQRLQQSAVRRARLLLDAGREPDAIADLQRHHITSQEASLALADIHTKNGDPQKAIDALELPAQRLQQSAVRRADLLSDMARYEEARQTVEPHIERDVEALMRWVTAELQLGELAVAIHGLRKSRGSRKSMLWRQVRTAENVLFMAQAATSAGFALEVAGVASAIWTENSERRRIVVLCSERLWEWVARPETMTIALQPMCAASLLEVVCVLTPLVQLDPLNADRLRRRVFDKLCDEVQGSITVFDAARYLAPRSELLQIVLDETITPVG